MPAFPFTYEIRLDSEPSSAITAYFFQYKFHYLIEQKSKLYLIKQASSFLYHHLCYISDTIAALGWVVIAPYPAKVRPVFKTKILWTKNWKHLDCSVYPRQVWEWSPPHICDPFQVKYFDKSNCFYSQPCVCRDRSFHRDTFTKPWISSWLDLVGELEIYVNHFHPGGLKWNI